MNKQMREARALREQYRRLVERVAATKETLFVASQYSNATFANTAEPDVIPLTRNGDDYVDWRVVFANNALMGAAKRFNDAATALQRWREGA